MIVYKVTNTPDPYIVLVKSSEYFKVNLLTLS